jgi:hypothetical protein
MKKELSKQDLKHIEELLHMGLDFVSTDLSQYLDDYIQINRKTFTEIGSVTSEMFDQWVKNWMVKNRIIVIDDL